MKKLFVLFVAALFILPARADEGMWLLPFLGKLNIKDMKAKGLKLKAEDIYNANGNSLKDAIVIFGGGCTAEVVSPEGLLLTNHHCGYGQIQSLSTVENDYLKNGFWAMSRAEEIPAPGLAVTFIRHIEDVTDVVLAGVENMDLGAVRDSIIKANHTAVSAAMSAKHAGYDVEVQDFMGANQFFAIATETYTDVRLVGTPPNSMGKFGGDTDNWMWPRHTDDFSMFRIYAGPNNAPAVYSPDNKPYAAPVHLKISTKGIAQNDFAMVMGFPGRTNRYMTTSQMEHLVNVENANRIYIRGERQKILMEDMLADDAVRLKYAAKYASSSNYWKNSIGMNKALAENHIPERKALLEAKFQSWAEGNNSPMNYRAALPAIKEAVEASSSAIGLQQYLTEALYSGIELVSGGAHRVFLLMRAGRTPDEIMASMTKFYKDYNLPTDRRAAGRMMTIVRDNIPAASLPSFYGSIDSLYGGNIDLFVDHLYNTSAFTSPDKLAALLMGDIEGLNADPAEQLRGSILATISTLGKSVTPHRETIAKWHGLYIKGLTEMDPTGKFYPDANFTIRLTYGSVLPYEPRDGVIYKYYTTLRGVIEKEDPSNPLEFTVPEKVKEAYYTSDYGRWGQEGELRVNFLTNNDITGGNSGSPVLNARGELIGLAFDGNWEAMSGDVVFEPELQRCINLDARYLLWTIDKLAGAGHLLDEMTIVSK